MMDHMPSMMNVQVPAQRLRVRFAKGDALKYISHLDLTRTWERIFRRAMLPVAHSQGFNPRPRFQIAAALPVGVTGGAELLDVWLTEFWKPEDVLVRLGATVPNGMQALAAEEVALKAPSLQSQLCAADYRAVVRSDEPVEGVRTRVRALLNAPTLLRQRHHKGKVQSYDLRPLVQAIDVEAAGRACMVLTMRLQANPQGAGRPDEVLDALGLALMPHTLERTNLYFEFDK
jgi:radical SAM-linked protein